MSQIDQKYNGWSNRETWVMNMILSGNYDRYFYESFEELKNESLKEEIPIYQFAEATKEWFEELIDLIKGTKTYDNIIDDLGSQWRVNWYELVESSDYEELLTNGENKNAFSY